MSDVCQSCGKNVEQLIPIDAGKKLALSLSYDQVCPSCYEGLPQKVSQGMKLRQEEERKHENKIKLWKNRVNLIKSGRAFLKQKAYSEAALQYEKYLKILTIIYDVDALTPEIFNKSSRSKELTVITTVYWDLIKIYDTHKRYNERADKTINKLIEFAPYSPIFPDIVRKAEIFSRNCKRPAPVRKFLKMANSRKAGCFIATAAFDDGFAPEVQLFRQYRDQKLKKTPLGKLVISLYYTISPGIARFINRYAFLKPVVRMPLKLLAKWLRVNLNINSTH